MPRAASVHGMPAFVPDRVMSAYWRAAPAFHLLGVSALLLPLMGGACGEPENAAATGDVLAVAAETTACSLGDRRFTDETRITCDDGCNECRCVEKRWISTLALCAPLPKVERCDDPAQGVVQVDVLYRSKDALALELGTGGCQGETPPVKLCWDGAIAESAPVQMRLRAVPTAITSCSGWVTQQKVFDLSPLREAYEAAYPGHAGDIRVLLGADEVRYTF